MPSRTQILATSPASEDSPRTHVYVDKYFSSRQPSPKCHRKRFGDGCPFRIYSKREKTKSMRIISESPPFDEFTHEFQRWQFKGSASYYLQSILDFLKKTSHIKLVKVLRVPYFISRLVSICGWFCQELSRRLTSTSITPSSEVAIALASVPFTFFWRCSVPATIPDKARTQRFWILSCK